MAEWGLPGDFSGQAPRPSGLDGSLTFAEARRAGRVDVVNWDVIGERRTGTSGDRRTAEWLVGAGRLVTRNVRLKHFDLQRLMLGPCFIEVDGRSVSGVPLFDGGTTGPDGVRGRLAPASTKRTGIGFGVVGQQAGRDAIGTVAAARKANRHRAMVVVTKSSTAGLALENADRFNAPFGPPVLQVGSEHEEWLAAAAAQGAAARVVVDAGREPAEAWNVEARIKGRDASLAPLIVITPKSSWWTSTAERCGGIALWLALLRHLAGGLPRRSVVFVATSGHELGHLGLEAFLRANATVCHNAFAWFHLGANFGAKNSRVRLQASDAEMMDLAEEAMAAAEVPPSDRTPLGERPGGEARNVFDLGGRFISLLGTNDWFHHQNDRWPNTVDMDQAARLVLAAVAIADQLTE